MKAPRASLILLAWNRWDLTERALDSLLASDLDDCEILVVDNGSSDATVAGLAAYAGRLRVLRLPHNLGFVRGNNAGIAAADPSADLVLLNNDLVFTQRDWLSHLRACAQRHAGCGIVGCRLVDAQGRLLHAGTRVLPDDGIGVQTPSGRVERDVGQYSAQDAVVEGVVFAAVYIRREVIDAIGALHTDYTTYAEDSDYCLRARAAGWHTRLCGGVTLRHDQHGSTAADAARRAQLLADGRATFARHWAAQQQAQYDLSLHIAGAFDFPRTIARPLRPFARALDAAGVRLSYASLYAEVLPEAIAESGDSRDHLLNALRRRRVTAHATLCVGDAALWARVAAGYRIGYADFEQLPAQPAALRQMDELWVPSEWHRRQLLDGGWPAPVEVVPWVVDTAYAHAQLRARRNPHGERVVLCCARWDATDAPWQLLQAWTRRYRRVQPLRLLLQIDAPATDLAAATRDLDLDAHGGRYSLLPRPLLAEEQQQAIFAAADVVICASRSNSRCWPLLQAIAVARPTIAAARGARAELLHLADAWPVAADDEVPLADAVLDELNRVLDDLPAAQARAARGSSALAASFAVTAQRVRARLQAVPAPPRRAGMSMGTSTAQALVVLGMHRSGTSCVAGLLQLFGAYAGAPGGFLHHPPENARGFVERRDLHLACVAALRRRGGDWSVPLGWDESAAAAAGVQLRADWAPIQRELDGHAVWVIKEPRLCLLFGEIAAGIAAPVLIHVVRAPTAAAASVQRRDGLVAAHTLALWEYYNLSAAVQTQAHRHVVVDYHRLLQQPLQQTQRLYRQLQALGVGGLRLPEDEEVGAWIGPQLARQRQAREPRPTPQQQQLWLALQQRAADADAALPELSAASLALLWQVAREHQARMQSEQESR